MKVLVLGAGGQLGMALMRLLPRAVGLDHRELSVTDRAGIERACREHHPEVVFNCAAYNAVDRAESEPDLARKVNSEGPAIVGAECRLHRARFVHFSTNFVFDGLQDGPYVEADVARPLSVYGRSKLEGEQALLAAMPEALVIRTAALYGVRGSAATAGSFPERIVERALLHQRLRVVSDQRVNPTYAADLARAAIALAESQLNGLVHVVSAGCCAWDEFARAALHECGIEAEVEAMTSAELAAPARRPHNGCLASVRTESLRPWREGLAEWAATRNTVEPGRQ